MPAEIDREGTYAQKPSNTKLRAISEGQAQMIKMIAIISIKSPLGESLGSVMY